MKVLNNGVTEKINQLESILGDPCNISSIISFENSIANDENSIFPEQESNILNSLEINKLFIPESEGGDLTRFDEMMLIFRSIFRRDPSFALGYGMTTFMASIHIWIFGTKQQKDSLAKIIKLGNTVSVAYHEKNNGNDLSSSKLFVLYDGNKFYLNGQKWIINNALESKVVLLFAKTGNTKSAKDYSIFFLEKDIRYNDQIKYLKKIKTLGVRSCRISGFDLNNYPVSEDNTVKGLGFGFEQTFKSFQVTRAILPGMSLGAADTYLRKLYSSLNKKTSLSEIEKDILAENFIGLLICDIISMVATRSIHVVPEQLSIISAVTKYFVPKCLLTGIHKLTDIISVDSIIREGDFAILQKILRDFPVVSFGHSNDVVCLSVILYQIKQLTSKSKLSNNFLDNIKSIFCLDYVLPEIDFGKLKMSNSGYLDIVNSIFLINECDEVKNNFSEVTLKTVVELIKVNLSNVKNQVDKISLNIKDFSKKTYSILDNYVRCYVVVCCIYFLSMNESYFSHFFDINDFILTICEFIFSDKRDQFNLIREGLLKSLDYFNKKNLAFSFLTMNYQ